MDLLIDPASWDLVFHNGPLTKEYTTQPFTQTVGQRLKTLDKVFPNSKDNHLGAKYLVLDENLPPNIKTRDYLRLKCITCEYEFSQRANSVLLGVISCKCSKSFRRSQEDYLSEISQIAEANDFVVKNISYSKPLSRSNIELYCNICNNQWTTSINSILHKGSGCVHCSGHYQPSKQEYTQIIKQRLSDKFELLEIGDNNITKSTKITVKCKRCSGFSTKTVTAVVHQTPSCPCCANWGFDPSVENTLYLIRLSDHKSNFFYKVGITCNTKRRFKELSRDNKMDVDVINTWVYPPFTPILQHESYLKDNFAIGRSCEKPFNHGYTEVVSIESLPILISVQNLQYGRISSGLTS